MDVRLLIDSIVRQTTVLLAQLATHGGARAPLAHVANQVFFELSEELRRQGVSRKVSADMFGLALRTYLRRVQRSNESITTRGVTVWQAVREFVEQRKLVLRAEVLSAFHRDPVESINGVLFDLSESGLIFRIGSGAKTAFRAATNEELATLQSGTQEAGDEELLWAIVYREGPIARTDLLQRWDPQKLEQDIERLLSSGRVLQETRLEGVFYDANEFFSPLELEVGWAAAVFDHYHAVVKTICARLNAGDGETPDAGGSTYSMDLWEGHPHLQEAEGQLSLVRERLSALRQRVRAYNANTARPEHYRTVTFYAGQCVLNRQSGEAED